MIQSYKKNYKALDHYDTIFIGSGLGSLTSAALMAKEGKKVLVLERHYTAGGFTHIFKRRGYEWDVGIHYIGEVHREQSVLRKLFDYITDSKLKWADMGEVYDRIVIGDKTYDFVKGTANFKEKLKEYFPAEADAIDQYVDLVFKVTKTSRNFYMEKAMPPMVSKVSGGLMRNPYLKYATRTTQDVLEEITQNQELIKVLTGQYGDYGLPPKQSSFGMHASLVRHYFSGGNFPVGGSSQVVDTIAPVLEASGSTILVSAEVEEIIIEDNKAVGVKMTDGKEFRADKVVSGAGVMTTYKTLMPEATVKKHQLNEQITKVNNSVAHLSLYIGLKGSPEELKLPKANYWVYPGDLSHDECVERYSQDTSQPFPVVYVSFPSAKDPDWSNRYPDRSTIDIITLMPYNVFEKWENTRWKKRGEDYEALKEEYSQRLLEELFKLEPHLRGKIDCYELSTPITTKHFINYEKGEIYGLDHSPERFKHKFLRPHTPIKNFYLTGQDIVTAGIGGALFSGLLTTSAITKKNLLKKVMG
ncbi:NAD(P)/FAD-dependent oxidoreductase [uncultured Microscilla sp.]|uniref:phytoene desaturase family protein n=1 Tax=uncultured Microscilla sp. TaxID=432653 RepID=UPI0026294491|nr:NAD(P)/FAD-dependent oxidoreductase [uncultured Microscilla sp.]